MGWSLLLEILREFLREKWAFGQKKWAFGHFCGKKWAEKIGEKSLKMG